MCSNVTQCVGMTIQDVARFNGVQEGIPGLIDSFELWTLTLDVAGLTMGSTYARETIERALRGA